MNIRENKVEFHDDGFLLVDVSTKASPCSVMKIDEEDWLYINRIASGGAWACAPKNRCQRYACVSIGGRVCRIHMLILGKKEGMVIDHINNDGLDNRRCNLRHCTPTNNQMNKRMQKCNTTGIVGVVVCKRRNKYQAQIKVNGRYIMLGRFDNIKDAETARKDAEVKYFGEFQYKGSAQ